MLGVYIYISYHIISYPKSKIDGYSSGIAVAVPRPAATTTPPILLIHFAGSGRPDDETGQNMANPLFLRNFCRFPASV